MSRQVNTATSSAKTTVSGDSFAERLNSCLVGTTSEAFARRIDKTLRTVQRWRAGDSQPTAPDLLLIARALEIDPRELYPPVEEAA